MICLAFDERRASSRAVQPDAVAIRG